MIFLTQNSWNFMQKMAFIPEKNVIQYSKRIISSKIGQEKFQARYFQF
jgi:hypothetical protein